MSICKSYLTLNDISKFALVTFYLSFFECVLYSLTNFALCINGEFFECIRPLVCFAELCFCNCFAVTKECNCYAFGTDAVVIVVIFPNLINCDFCKLDFVSICNCNYTINDFGNFSFVAICYFEFFYAVNDFLRRYLYVF